MLILELYVFILAGFVVAQRVSVVFYFISADFERAYRTRMRAVKGHDVGAHQFSADLKLNHFTVPRFSGAVLRFGKLIFRTAKLPKFDMPDMLAGHC